MRKWDSDLNLYLITPQQFDVVPDGTELTCIDGTVVIKGVSNIDDDVRFGYLAYGFIDPYNRLDKELLTMLCLLESKGN